MFYLEYEKKEVFHDLHKLVLLGFQLVHSTKGCVMVHKSSKSLFLMDVNSKQDFYPILM